MSPAERKRRQRDLERRGVWLAEGVEGDWRLYGRLVDEGYISEGERDRRIIGAALSRFLKKIVTP